MKTLVAVCSALALTGCACKPKIEYVNVPVEVKVPVPVKCKVTLPPKPIEVIPGIAPTEMYYDKAMALMNEAEQYRRYSKELEAAVSVCVEEK